MIVITGAAGFIGSVIVKKLNILGIDDIVLVDDFSKIEKEVNWITKKYNFKVDRTKFESWANENKSKIEFIVHIGARTDTSEFNSEIFDQLNLNYSKMIWNFVLIIKFR